MASFRLNQASTGMRRLGWRRGLIAIVAAVAVVLAASAHTIHQRALVATAYGARMACSCHYVAGRPLADCPRDFEPGMSLVGLSDNAVAHSVTARFALLAPQTATWRVGMGCELEPWRD